MRKILNPISLAISLLTRIPPFLKEAPRDDDWRSVSAFFPLTGYVVGATASIPAIALLLVLPHCKLPDAAMNPLTFAVLSSVLYVAVSAWMTRMFHLDGFCDACDAFSSMSSSPSERLEIMKDPHPGAAAVCATSILLITKTALIFLLIARFAILLENKCVTANFTHTALSLLTPLIAIPAAARFAMSLLAWLGKYPREKGTGMKVVEGADFAGTAAATATLLPLALLLSPRAAIAIFATAIFAVLYWRRKANKLIGGVTGDILGACCETAECLVALALILA